MIQECNESNFDDIISRCNIIIVDFFGSDCYPCK